MSAEVAIKKQSLARGSQTPFFQSVRFDFHYIRRSTRPSSERVRADGMYLQKSSDTAKHAGLLRYAHVVVLDGRCAIRHTSSGPFGTLGTVTTPPWS